jgi:hypothetical protein
MEANSDEEQHNRSKNNVGSSNEGQSKPKRQMKTPFQLETLEKAYASPYTSSFSLYVYTVLF